MKSLKDVFNEIESNKMNADILLGNGFSEGFDSKFNYSSLLEKVYDNIKENRLIKLLDKNKKEFSNLEYYLKLMIDAGKCIPFIRGTEYINLSEFKEEQLHSDIGLLKEIILDTFSQIHPDSYSGKESDLVNCANNLKLFHRIYTLNYDFVLYWCILKVNEIVSNKFTDGMWKKCDDLNLHKFSDLNNKFNVQYLHGAVHLVTDIVGDTFKIIKNNDDKKLKELISIMKDQSLSNYFNLMVFEGTSLEKMNIISNNSYLHKGLQRIATMKENLVIYGCSILNDNDEINNDFHIWDRIINSECKKIFIGIHSSEVNTFNEKEKAIRKVLTEISHKDFEKREIEFFETVTNSIWDSIIK